MSRNCPVCGKVRYRILYIQKFSGHFNHKIANCLKCGFVFVVNIPSKTYYEQYYKEESKYEGIRQHESHEKSTVKEILTFFSKYIKKNSSILDIGCATGSLLSKIKQKGYKNIFGIDPAPKCKQIAKKNYQIDIKTTDLDHFNSKKKYDFIILSQVLEHLTDIRKSINRINFLLKDTGYVFIGVPDAGSFYTDFKEPFGEFSTEHINFFSKSSLYRLMENYTCHLMKTSNSAIYSVWQRGSEEKRGIEKYINESKEKLDYISSVIDHLPSQTIVWGVGALTQRLLKSTNLKKRTFKFVDTNPNLINKTIDGVKIIAPSELKSYNNPIFVSSFRFRDEIKKEITARHLKNKVISFNYE